MSGLMVYELPGYKYNEKEAWVMCAGEFLREMMTGCRSRRMGRDFVAY